MTLFYDGSEARYSSTLPKDVIEYGYQWNRVEAETGGDFVVTPGLSLTHKAILMSRKYTVVQIANALGVTVPEAAKMQSGIDDMDSVLYEYLYLGSIVVQRKSGADLIASVQGSRLGESLSRMNRAVPYRSQRMLLYTGVFSELNGNVVLDGKETGLKYSAFVMALTAWCNRGGTLINLASDAHTLEWIKLLEKQLESYKHEDFKYVFSDVYFPDDMPDVDDILQLPVEVNDWRKTMVTFPGLGSDRVNALRTYLENKFGVASLWNALQVATSKSATKIHGWGPKSVSNSRAWLGIPDTYELVLQPESEDKNG